MLHKHVPLPTDQRITAVYNKPNTEGLDKVVVSQGVLATCKCGKQFIRHDEKLPRKWTELE